MSSSSLILSVLSKMILDRRVRKGSGESGRGQEDKGQEDDDDPVNNDRPEYGVAPATALVHLGLRGVPASLALLHEVEDLLLAGNQLGHHPVHGDLGGG